LEEDILAQKYMYEKLIKCAAAKIMLYICQKDIKWVSKFKTTFRIHMK